MDNTSIPQLLFWGGHYVLCGGVGYAVGKIARSIKDRNLHGRQKWAIILVLCLGLLGVLWL